MADAFLNFEEIKQKREELTNLASSQPDNFYISLGQFLFYHCVRAVAYAIAHNLIARYRRVSTVLR